MLLERGILLNNRYRIVEILGQGGMGSVYRAVDENLGVEVAVKDNLFTTEEYARQFRREAIILANLRHPNLPRVTDHFVITGQGQYLVMDYIEGEDLRQRMDRVGLLPQEEVIVIGAAVCDALAYLGTRNPPIIHRDIKPGNIKITPQGQIFLVDFGLAKTMYGTQVTTTGARAMTPGYSPPEQYGTGRTDQRSDVFSLGATLFAALAGTTPEDALSRAMDQSELTPLSKHNPSVSKKMSSVIESALKVRPDDRYQTAEDFKQALLSVSSDARRRDGDFSVSPPPDKETPLQGEGGVLGANAAETGYSNLEDKSPQLLPVNGMVEVVEDRPEPLSPPSRRLSCLSIFLISVALLVGVIFLSYLIYPEFPSSAISRIQPIIAAAVATPTKSASPEDEDFFTPTFSQVSSSNTPEVIIQPTSTNTATMTLIPTETPLPSETPTLVPTAQGGGSGQIAFASDRTGVYQIYMIHVDGTGLQQITDISEGACQPSWAPDGERLVFTSPCVGDRDYYPESALYVINVDGSGLLPLPASIGGDYDPAWSPDGSRIAFTSLRKRGRPQIYVIEMEDYSFKGLSDEYDFSQQPTWSPDGKQIMYVSSLQGTPSLWVMNSADGSDKQKISDSNLINIRPDWSPDRETILFTQYVALGGIPKLVMSPYDLNEYLEFRVSQETLPMREGRYSPDGYWIAFEGWEAGGDHNIFIVTATGAGRRAVTTDPRLDIDPAWRPTPLQ